MILGKAEYMQTNLCKLFKKRLYAKSVSIIRLYAKLQEKK